MLRACLTIIGLALALSSTAAPEQHTDADGFRPIAAWHAYRGVGVPPQWVTKDGVIDHTPGGGDLTSDEVFGNFELALDWRIAPGGNSGVIYRVSEDYGAPYSGGPEYQSSTMPRRKAATIHCSRRRAATASIPQRPLPSRPANGTAPGLSSTATTSSTG